MPLPSKQLPCVLSISGHDPTGGAGIIADTEVFIHHQCQPCTILTCLTVQDSSSVYQLIPLSASDIIEQAEVLFNDLAIAAIKIGLTGSVECIHAIVSIIKQHPDIPVIFDPVLASGDGTTLANDELIQSISQHLLPLVDVLTPNTLEAKALSGSSAELTSEQLGLSLLNQGSKYVLITGGHTAGELINNQLFNDQKLIQQYQWARQAGDYHGTGCTLASAIAALIAHGNSIESSVAKAQAYTDLTIKNARQFGSGQAFPNRSL